MRQQRRFPRDKKNLIRASLKQHALSTLSRKLTSEKRQNQLTSRATQFAAALKAQHRGEHKKCIKKSGESKVKQNDFCPRSGGKNSISFAIQAPLTSGWR
jgi:hypothetical protein